MTDTNPPSPSTELRCESCGYLNEEAEGIVARLRAEVERLTEERDGLAKSHDALAESVARLTEWQVRITQAIADGAKSERLAMMACQFAASTGTPEESNQ